MQRPSLCRKQAREAMRAASYVVDAELAEHYRDLAAKYITLARCLEQRGSNRAPGESFASGLEANMK